MYIRQCPGVEHLVFISPCIAPDQKTEQLNSAVPVGGFLTYRVRVLSFWTHLTCCSHGSAWLRFSLETNDSISGLIELNPSITASLVAQGCTRSSLKHFYDTTAQPRIFFVYFKINYPWPKRFFKMKPCNCWIQYSCWWCLTAALSTGARGGYALLQNTLFLRSPIDNHDGLR